MLVTAVAQAGNLDRAEAVARTITDPYDQARALNELITAAAKVGDLDSAGRLLGRALLVDLPGVWWVETVADFFPSAIEEVLSILVSAYTTQA